MKKTIKKILTGFVTACMVVSASSLTVFAADTVNLNETGNAGSTTVRYTIDSGWTATIPAYINPSEQGNADTEAYSVTVSDVMLGNSATLVGTVEYDGKLVEANDVELGYVLCDADGEIITNKEIIYADAGSPDATTSFSFGAELTEKPKFAGNYLGTATFNFAVNERVFAIGETKPENVIAKFNEDYSEVDIFTAGNDSDGIMKDFSGDSPMQEQAVKLETAAIESGVTKIGSQAFNSCDKLTSVAIPDTVTSIGSDSFEDCGSLNTIYGSYGSAAEEWAENNSFDFVNTTVYTAEDIENDDHLFAIGETKPEYVVAKFNDDFTKVNIFANGNDSDGIMKGFSGKLPWNTINTVKEAIVKNGVTSMGNTPFNSLSLLTAVSIPDSVTSLSFGAFRNCTSLESIVIPDSVTEIGSQAFYGCEALKSVSISNNVAAVSDDTFYNCKSLTDVTLGSSITVIGTRAFNNCESLKSITIPDGVATISERAFYNCVSLENVHIPDSVKTIGESAFCGCRNLSELVIGNGVTTIGNNAFYDCRALQNVNIPDRVESIGNYVFKNCGALSSVNIGNSVTTIGDNAFDGCASLNSIDLPNSITKIGSRAFIDCSLLESVKLPNNINTINAETFYNCSSLTNILIPENVKSINTGAFRNCSSLESITIPSGVSLIHNAAFTNSPNLTSIHGYSGSYAETWANSNGYTFVAMD